MIPLFAIMIGAYIVARCCDIVANRSPNATTQGISAMTALFATGVAIVCTALIIRESMQLAELFERVENAIRQFEATASIK